MNYWERLQIRTTGNFLSLRHIKETLERLSPFLARKTLEKEEMRAEEEEEYEYTKSTVE